MDTVANVGISQKFRVLTEGEQKGLEKIERFSFELVREKILEKGKLSAEMTDEAILEFKRFLALIGLGYRGLGMTSKEVDEVWHTFILFTKDYANFCQDTFGFFLHHNPRTSKAPVDKANVRNFAIAYREVFGKVPEIWNLKNTKVATDCTVDCRDDCWNCSTDRD